jgi:NAD(P)H-hydrate epimerase
MWIISADQARALDARSQQEFGLKPADLMERAAAHVFRAVEEMLSEGARLTVFCGKGNNGGDGLAVARLAHRRKFLVECLVAAQEEELSPDARLQLAKARRVGVEPIFYGDARWHRKADCVGCRDLVVDALLGTGARHAVTGPVREAIESINRAGVPVVSVDVPSGIDCDTGEELGESVWALRTITFGLPKPFLFQGTGLEHAGAWEIASLGHPPVLLAEPTGSKMIDAEWAAQLLPERMRASHKGENGRLLIVAGSARYRGAAALATLGALHAGIGLVAVAAPR